MTRPLLLVLLAAALLLWARTALYTVDYTEFVYVTRFGEKVAVHDGATAAGLHAKLPWPVDSVLRLDRRTQAFDLPAVESLTRDPLNRTVDKTLAVDAFVVWRIPDATAAEQFVRAVGTPEQARKILAPRVNGRLAAVVSTLPLEDLVSVADVGGGLAAAVGAAAPVADAGGFRAADLQAIDDRTERVRRRLLGDEAVEGADRAAADHLRERALADYGIEIVDVRVRRFSYPEAVRGSIAERIRSERARKVADYESDGRRRAAEIASDADRDARTTEAEARANRKRVEEQARADADRILNDAHAKDREFYVFLEKLRAYQTMLADTRDVLLLSTKHELFDLLLKPPPQK